MKRWITGLLSTLLVIALAVPSGAAFAFETATDESLVEPAESTPAMIESSEPVAPLETFTENTSHSSAVEVSTSPANEPMSTTTEPPEIEPIASVGIESTTPADSRLASGLIITELQTRSVTSAQDERVVLYNAGTQPIDITQWCLVRRTSPAGSTARLTCFTPSEVVLGGRVLIPPGASIVIMSTYGVEMHPQVLADASFSAGLSDTSGQVSLQAADGTTVDSVSWGSFSADSAPGFATNGYTLQRVTLGGGYQDNDMSKDDFFMAPAVTQYETGALYEVIDRCSNIEGIQLTVPEGMLLNGQGVCIEADAAVRCRGVRLTEVAANVARQFIELTNQSHQTVSLTGCKLMTNRSTTLAEALGEYELEPGSSIVVYIEATHLKLTKSSTGKVYLIDMFDDSEVDSVSYEDLSSDTSWALFPDGWKQTYTLTPGQVNSYAQYESCQEGYERNVVTGRCRTALSGERVLVPCADNQYRNEATGRCRLLESAVALTPCKEGQYRNESTNRCRSLASTVSTMKPCADNQFRNPATNRCKAIASADDVALADCGEGRERNPETNRCRNVVASVPANVGYAVEPVDDARSSFGWWVLGAVASITVGYIGWEWRDEIKRSITKIGDALRSGRR